MVTPSATTGSLTDPRSTAWSLVKCIAVADPGDAAFEQAVDIASSGVDPDLLMGLAARHRLAPAVADFYRSAELKGLLPAGIRQLLFQSLYWNRLRTRAMTTAALEVSEEFGRQGITFAFTKGVVCQATLYDRRGTRYFSDIDIMILPEEQDAVSSALVGLGYQTAKRYDRLADRLYDMPRDELLVYKLYPDHLPHFRRIDRSAPVPDTTIDVAYSLTWYGSEWQIPLAERLAQRTAVSVGEGLELPSLDDFTMFLFLILHTFRENWFDRFIATGAPRLTHYADIHRQWNRSVRDRAADAADLISQLSIGPAAAWVCHHVDALFGTTIVSELQLEEYADPAWLNSAAAVDGGYLRWSDDMDARLSGVGRPGVSCPEPPYATAARGSLAS
ncbi:nucleotidyltransferase family protein [Nonomuraea africana]|uniref:nucleotidyltransferase family protein n=1 Tax=Nonomuraea africana TaxID=46171 RepID=UPI0033E38BFF